MKVLFTKIIVFILVGALMLCVMPADVLALRPASYAVSRRGFLGICKKLAVAAAVTTLPLPILAVTDAESTDTLKQARKIDMAKGQIKEVDSSDLPGIRLEVGQQYGIYKVKDEKFYYIEFSSVATQNKTFNRLSAFVESTSYSGEVLDDQRLEEAIQKNQSEIIGVGHDYSIEAICRFYAEARRKSVRLNMLEENLKNDLLKYGFISFAGGVYISVHNIAVVSAAQDIDSIYETEGLRQSTISHEFNHGIYMTDSWYRQEVSKLWGSLKEKEKAALKNVLNLLGGYDMKNEDLVMREFAAHCRSYRTELVFPAPKRLKWFIMDNERFFEKLQVQLQQIELERAGMKYIQSDEFRNALENRLKKLQKDEKVPDPNDNITNGALLRNVRRRSFLGILFAPLTYALKEKTTLREAIESNA